MNRILKFIASLLFCIASTLQCIPTFAQNQEGFVDLIDGVSLSDWNVVGNASWKIGNGIVEGNKPNGFLVSTKTYKNFVIRAEFWAESDTNSGIFIRCQNPTNISATSCYEVNIWDIRPEQAYATGAIVDIAKVDPIHKAGGRWNVMEIIANGSHFKVILNGVVTVADGYDTKFSEGPIALQSAGGVIKFKRVQIKPI